MKRLLFILAIVMLTSHSQAGWKDKFKPKEEPKKDQKKEVCKHHELEYRDCGNCGMQSRECNSEGQWAEWGECFHEGECAPGSTVSCCLDGIRTCSEKCLWSECSKGECVPGEVRQFGECEKCGTIEAVCTDKCNWPEGACVRTGECEPGKEEKGKSEKGHKQVRYCLPDCSWSIWTSIPTVNGYQKAKFGMTPSQVKRLYPGKEFYKDGDMMLMSDKFQADDMIVGFQFYKNKLYSVMLMFDLPSFYEDDYIDKYNYLLNLLKEKYGEPFGCDHDEYPFSCVWRGEPGNILLFLGRKNSFDYGLSISYYDPVIFEKAQIEQEKKAKEKL